jgi:hypothetical protein
MVIRAYKRMMGPEVILPDGSRRPAPRHDSRDGQHESEGFYIQAGPGIPRGTTGPTVAGEDLAEFFCAPAAIDLKALTR